MSSVASALYCFLRTPNDFEETVIATVMGGGNTDTTGAVAGAISGAFNAVENKAWGTSPIDNPKEMG